MQPSSCPPWQTEPTGLARRIPRRPLTPRLGTRSVMMMIDRRVPDLPLLGTFHPLERDRLKIRQRRGHRRLPDRKTQIHRIQAGRSCLHTVDRQGQDPERLQTLQGSQTGTELRECRRLHQWRGQDRPERLRRRLVRRPHHHLVRRHRHEGRCRQRGYRQLLPVECRGGRPGRIGLHLPGYNRRRPLGRAILDRRHDTYRQDAPRQRAGASPRNRQAFRQPGETDNETTDEIRRRAGSDDGPARRGVAGGARAIQSGCIRSNTIRNCPVSSTASSV